MFKQKKRRSFIALILLSISTSLMAKKDTKTFNMQMQGELDDDLIIYKKYYSSNHIKEIVCLQMHNFSKSLRVGDNEIKSRQIPGYIKFKKDIQIEANSITALFTANEREDRDSNKTLMFRTHYKSAPLYINKKEFFPSIIPEDNDVPNYPTWYLKEEDYYTNYYRLWENATVLNGFITHISGPHQLLLFNKENDLVSKSNINIKENQQYQVKFKKVKNVDISNNHIFTELDNKVFNDSKNINNDKFIKENAVHKVMIINANGSITFDLPYPCPYINTYYIKHIGA